MNIKKLLVIITIIFMLPITVKADSLKLTDKHINTTEPSNKYMMAIPNYDNNKKPIGIITYGEYRQTAYASNSYPLIKIYDKNNKLKKTYLNDLILNQNDFKDGFGIMTLGKEMMNMTPKGVTDAVIGVGDSSTNQYDWIKQFGGNGMDMFYLAIKSYNNEKHDGYLVIGITTSTDLKELNPGYFILKYDLNGELKWQENIGEYIVKASFGQNGKQDGLITVTSGKLNKVDYNFQEIFNIEKKYGELLSLAYSRDNSGKIDGYIATGISGCGTKIEERENDVQKRLLDPFKNIFSSTQLKPKITPVSDCYHYAMVTKYDLNGNEIFEKVYTNLRDAELINISEIKNSSGNYDGYIMLGKIPGEKTETDGIMVKLDENLNIIQKETYVGGQYQNQLVDLTESYNEKGKFNGYNIVGVHSCFSLENSSKENTRNIQPMKVELLATDEICKGSDAGLLLKYTYPEYEIKKTVKNGGTVTIDETAMAGSVVYMRINPEPGYELKEIIVTDEKGNRIEVKNNSFIMPEGKVNIEAIFKRIINPETVAPASIIILLAIIIGIGTTVTMKKKHIQE